ncbi:unnamed protein product [Schistosoma mattheei]|uniref:Uncharacterized protein n=1 Tax=Schistosoma mattheei TaxID=31246 RepID=A0A3P8HUS8_9TREM|nr:unnamed protein product [Schistosoma mattheei]
MASKFSKPERPVNDKEGKPNNEIQEQRNRWVEHFEELLNRSAPLNPPDIEAAHRPSNRCHSTSSRRNQHGHQTNQE